MEKFTKEQFIEKAKKIHGDKYDYSKVEYKGNKIKVCIICPIHGEFWQEPRTHLQGCGCWKCKKNFKLSTKTWIEKAKKIHGDKYDYSKVEYTNNKTKVCIVCPIHGEFWQNPNSHLQGFGCKKCGINSSKEKQILGKIEFIKKANLIHLNKYDYSKVEYINNNTKVCIVCPKHGEFWQTPASHINGKSGCPFCSIEENTNEERLYKSLLISLKEEIVRWKKFKWLRYKNPMSLDIYIPSKKTAIEYQGDQHFMEVDWYGGKKGLTEQIKRDLEKIRLCKEHGIKLLHFTYNNKIKWNEYEIYNDFERLLELI